MKIFRFTLYLIIIVFLISSKSYSQEPFVVTSESLEIIPNKHLSFLEGFDETISFDTLENAEWSEKRLNAQSMVEGYWVRFSIKNNLLTENIGLSHNFNREKKIFTKNSLGITEFDYWKRDLTKHITDNHIGSRYKIIMPKNELTVVYDFFRNNPVDRFNSKENYHRMLIGSWDNLRFKEISRVLGRVAFLTPILLFGIYFLFVYLISKGNYIWISLALLQISIIIIGPMSVDFSLGLPHLITSGNAMIFFLSLLFLFLTQFFRRSLSLETRFPRINKIFIASVIFYFILGIVNFILLINWPNEEQLNLTKYPPNNLGPGLIKFHIMVIPFIIILIMSICVSFKLWREGSPASGYLCLSFILPLFSLPVALLAYLIFDGFNTFSWAVITPFSGFLFLGMFTTFGFSVAQGMNDLKQEFIDKQLALNNELESKVDTRTADLRKTSEELTAANNDINKSIQAASVIQNAILPQIDLSHYGFRDLEYVWQPRDTIGGDFYWLEKKDGWTCLVVADCTGHGIPGAFMTLISSTLLDRISSIKNLSRPDAILNDLDEFLQKSLSLDETHQQTDFGLDAGVCCFSLDEKIFRYSGAKMNLYQKSAQGVVEIKGDKKSLGYDIKQHPLNFKVFECELNQQSSSFFVFSDGVTDQVGGEKKLMYGKKRVINQIREATDVKTAVTNIVSDVERYQGVNKRRDDLTLFGFAV